MTAASILLALLLVEPVANPIRSHHARIVKAIAEASLRSATFNHLLDRVKRSDLIIYIESGRCPNRQVMSCVAFAATSNSYRYLRMTIDTNHSLQLILSQIAHELQHVIEIADTADVVDEPTLRAFYGRIATTSANRDIYETAEAIAVAARVALELTAQTGTHNPQTKEPR
jgi:hypothetical protein